MEYLDGLRGLAALYVVLHHAYLGSTAEAPLSGLATRATYVLFLGRSAVDIFIVLSGYCLMLPMARAGVLRLRSGFGPFLLRRARRILPPYYAALGVTLLAIWLVPALRDRSHPAALWEETLPAWTPGVIVSHLLLIHNFEPSWHSKIDYPMWSVATEWQIYFVFPLVLLPIRRRFGLVACVVAAFAAGLLPLCFFFSRWSGVSPQFLGLFAIGMAAAEISFARAPQLTRVRDTWPWGWLAAAFAVSLCLANGQHSSWQLAVAMKDSLVGTATACLLVCCTRRLIRDQNPSGDVSSNRLSRPSRTPVLLRVMESRWAVLLGTFSYSLYLIHAPILALLQAALRPQGFSPLMELAMMLTLGTALALLGSGVFHLVFERPFLSHSLERAEARPQAIGQ